MNPFLNIICIFANESCQMQGPSDVLVMMGSLPDEVLALRKSAGHVIKLQEKMIVSLPPVSTSSLIHS